MEAENKIFISEIENIETSIYNKYERCYSTTFGTEQKFFVLVYQYKSSKTSLFAKHCPKMYKYSPVGV